MNCFAYSFASAVASEGRAPVTLNVSTSALGSALTDVSCNRRAGVISRAPTAEIALVATNGTSATCASVLRSRAGSLALFDGTPPRLVGRDWLETSTLDDAV